MSKPIQSEAHSSATSIAQMRQLLSDLKGFAGNQLPLSIGLSLGVALSEGIGLFLLIPLLAAAGVNTQTPTTHSDSTHPSAIQSWLNDSGLSLETALLAFVLLVAARYGLMFSRDRLDARLRLDLVHHLRARLFRAIASAQWGHISQQRHGDLQHGLTGDIQRVGMILQQISQLLVGTSLMLVYLLSAIWVSPGFSLLAVFACGLLLWLSFRGGQRASLKTGGELVHSNRQLLHTVEQFLGGLKWAKAHALEHEHIGLFQDLSDKVRVSQVDHQHRQSRDRLWFQLGSVLWLALLAWVAIAWGLSPAQLLLLLLVFIRLGPVVLRLAQSLRQLLFYLPAYSAFQRLEAQCLAHQRPTAASTRPRMALNHAIALRDIHFQYPDGEYKLEIPALSIPARQTLAVVGPSGAGKSSLVDLISGLLEPQSGSIDVDSVPIDHQNRAVWATSIAYVPQDSFVLDESVRRNLSWGSPEHGDSQLWQALEQAAAADFVRALPKGLDSLLGPRGVRLSGGQAQRIALARALLRDAPLLILDEATSALDRETELGIQRAIEALRGQRTVIIIAHRLSTIRHADHLLVLDQGHPVQTGTWSELAADETGLFARMISREDFDRGECR